ncbi:uncharacterized protein LOC125227570 [Leguminivora glycinivorella]|uniref:uncharacterized protein LOC125227570 n=1 Tax=Leguminivora glycinivorella TaxID=1035111 RepID=UPI00200C8B1A|nr:uncharacterized protein LOC125227570 [Leguminivora glycinivorella]
MSPLARSLLALAALIAAADAELPNYCSNERTGKQVGIPADNVEKFTLTVSGGLVRIPDKCTRPGNKMIGEYKSVCNIPNYQPKIRHILKTHRRYYDSEIYIDCPSNITGCDSLKLEITQYCQMVVAPHSFI